MAKIDVSKIGNVCPHCEGSGQMEQTVGSRLTWLRKQTGQTQTEVATALAMSRTALTNMERGRQNLTQQNIKLICRHFEVSADWLLGISE